ncbi:MAG: hypothetical protein AB8E15_13310 [Bdellovibrionales bacterium]
MVKIGNYKLVSKPQNASGKNSTDVYSLKSIEGKPLWSFEQYVGKTKILIDESGEEIVLFGSSLFGNLVRNSEETIILEIVKKGQGLRSYTYNDITGLSLVKEVEKLNLPPLGGGWIGIDKLITIDSMNWENRTINFKAKQKPIPFSF